MSRPPATVEAALAEMQRCARQSLPSYAQFAAMQGRVPEDLATPDARTLVLSDREVQLLTELRWLLSDDQRFEYMEEREIERATWRFACLASTRPAEDHASEFVANHAREPMWLTCFLPVMHLTLTSELSFQDVRIIPTADIEFPSIVFGPDPQPTTASVAAVETVGTDHKKMRSRAMAVAEHALRLLRAGLSRERFLHEGQLRFAFGESFWFSDGVSGWQTAAGIALGYEPSEAALRRATSGPMAALPRVGGTDVERQANLALQWFEQAQLTPDALMRLLFIFFALEAILGRKSDKNKAYGLALRRAVLSHKTTEHFAHPGRVYLLYDQVRNAAVHGSQPPEVPKGELDAFAWDARNALDEFLEYSSAECFVRRSRVLEALDSDPAAAGVAERFLSDTRGDD